MKYVALVPFQRENVPYSSLFGKVFFFITPGRASSVTVNNLLVNKKKVSVKGK